MIEIEKLRKMVINIKDQLKSKEDLIDKQKLVKEHLTNRLIRLEKEVNKIR